ncbi:hypothetical protein THAOC_10359, partial [Thalassiosira oceanica]
MLTCLLWQATARVGARYGLEPEDVSVRSMRTSGEQWLFYVLCAEVDPQSVSQNPAVWPLEVGLHVVLSFRAGRLLPQLSGTSRRRWSQRMRQFLVPPEHAGTPVHDLVTKAKEQDASLYKLNPEVLLAATPTPLLNWLGSGDPTYKQAKGPVRLLRVGRAP